MSILYLEKDGRSFHQRVVCCVFFSSWFGTEPRIPLVKHITQMCHKRGWAWTVQKASVSPLEHSLMRRWHASLLLFWGCHGGVQLLIFFFWCDDSGEAVPSASSSPWQIAVKIWGSRGADIEMSKQKTMRLIKEERKSFEGFGWTFCPLTNVTWKCPSTL